MDSLSIRGYITLALWKNIGTTGKSTIYIIICFGEPKHVISEDLRPIDPITIEIKQPFQVSAAYCGEARQQLNNAEWSFTFRSSTKKERQLTMQCLFNLTFTFSLL